MTKRKQVPGAGVENSFQREGAIRPLPLYERIKAHVRDRILDGTWQVGDKVPSEFELSATLGASRLTVHRAFRELVAEGILTRLHGVGTFVARKKPASLILHLHNIADEIRGRGERFSTKVVRLGALRASIELAGYFDVPPESTLYNSIIVYCADDVPIQLEDRYVLPAFAPDYLNQNFLENTTTDYLQSISPATYANIEIEALMADAATCRLLEIPRAEPCLVVSRRTWVKDLITTYTWFYHPGSRHKLSSDLSF
jgi:GntR family transcriptional regulator, histidine utilization repressor